MSKDTSCFGTTCWFCGHSTTENKTHNFASVRYRACIDCYIAPIFAVTAEELREKIKQARNADVEEAKNALRGGSPAEPQYWTPAAFLALWKPLFGYSPALLEQYKWKEYDDPYAAATRERLEERKKAYRAAYIKQHKEKKDV